MLMMIVRITVALYTCYLVLISLNVLVLRGYFISVGIFLFCKIDIAHCCAFITTIRFFRELCLCCAI